MSLAERTQLCVDQILSLRKAELRAPGVDEIASVREDLERQLGPTLSRGMTAHLAGVSQTALDRWVTLGEIPTVITPGGKKAVPTRVALDLVEATRRLGAGQRHPLATVRRAERERNHDVVRIARDTLTRPLAALPKDHGLQDLRSLALHAVVAERLTPQIVSATRRRLRRLTRDAQIDPVYAERWERLLSAPLPHLKRAIVRDTQEARDLRQNTPFTGVLTDAERRAVLRMMA